MTEAITAPGSEGVAAAGAVVDLGLRACAAYERPDLAARLDRARAALADPAVHVVVAGEFKQGKSSLVNALLGAGVCPVDDDVATAVPTYVRYGPALEANVLLDGDPPRRESVPVDDVRRHVLEGATRSDAAPAAGRVVGVEIRLPRTMLATGLVVVDTPGVGGLGSASAAATLAAVSMADAVLFVTDASQELTRSERDFLRSARELCGTVVCVLTKTDFYPAWRRVRELDEQHLGGEGGLPVLPVSSPLRTQAVRAGDGDLNADSGFPALVEFVGSRVAGGGARRVAALAADEVAAVCRQLEGSFEAELAALEDPEHAGGVLRELDRAKQLAEGLRTAAARWQLTLQDGVADLASDVDHDLRMRLRSVLQEADDLLEEVDPADTWPEMQAWLEQAVSEELLANYAMLRDRAGRLSAQVAEHFRDASGAVFDGLSVATPATVLASARVDGKVDLDRMGPGRGAMVALKSSYGGVIMFTVLGSVAHVALGPLGSIGIGLVMGRKGLVEEKKRLQLQRRAQARTAVRRYCDEVSLLASKDSRDTLRRIQRQLRDHYATRAEELSRSSAEALRAAGQAASRTEAERARRVQDVRAELGRLRELRRRAGTLSAELVAAPVAVAGTGGGSAGAA